MRGRERLVPAALWVVGLAVALVQVRSFASLNDEGLVLQAAARIADGDLPYRDFWWNYGPGMPTLLAALEPLTGGPSLLAWRVLRAAVDATTAVVVLTIVRAHGGALLALAAWAATLLLSVVARLPNPNALAVLLTLLAIVAVARRPVLAGVLAGVVVWLRPELGAAAIVAVAVAAPDARARLRGAATGALAGALLWLPYVVAAGPGRVADLVIGVNLEIQPQQRLPLLPAVPPGTGPVEAVQARLPALLLALTAAAFVTVAVLHRRRAAPRVLLALTPVLVAGAGYLAGRADVFHLVPLVAVLPCAVALVAAAATPVPHGRLVVALAAVALALLVADGLERRVEVARADLSALAPAPGAAADGVRIDATDAAELRRIRTALDRRAPGRPIFVANARHDRVVSGASLAYVLLEREGATFYDVMTPVVAEAETQRELVADLERTSAPVVRWLGGGGALAEANAAGRARGARLLDDVLARRYAVAVPGRAWQLLLPRG